MSESLLWSRSHQPSFQTALIGGRPLCRRIISEVRPIDILAMTQLLEKALREVAKLSPSDQDAVATIMLEELASEQKWAELFAKLQDALARMAEEALAEHRTGGASAHVRGVTTRTA